MIGRAKYFGPLVAAAATIVPGFFIGGTAAQAHHSYAAFDRSHYITAAGTIVKFVWANPHVWIYLKIPDGKGSSELWSLESGPVSELARNGWRANSFTVGEHVRIVAQPLRDGGHGGNILTVTFDDGKILRIGTV